MLGIPRQATDTGGSRKGSESGQTLVEFALVIPIIMLMFMAVIELALGWNAFVGLNRASQQAAHLASVTGNQAGADCLILSEIESDVTAPNRRAGIQFVLIQRTSLAGNWPYQQQEWERSLSTDCTLPNGDEITIPYTLKENGYPEDQRCPALKGCPDLGRSTVDNIAVGIRYRHDWNTPLAAVITSLPGGALGWNFTQRNIFRIEPTL